MLMLTCTQGARSYLPNNNILQNTSKGLFSYREGFSYSEPYSERESLPYSLYERESLPFPIWVVFSFFFFQQNTSRGLFSYREGFLARSN
jgi:hypothetical protein